MDQSQIEILQVAMKIMIFCGILPGRGVKLTFFERASSIYLMVNCSILTFTSLIHIIYNTRRNTITPEEFIEDLSVIVSTISTIICVCYISLNARKIVTFVNSLRDFSDFSLPSQARQINKNVNFLTAFWASACVIGTFCYFVYKVFFDKDCFANNIRLNRRDICGTFVPTWLPFTIPKEKKWILHFIQLNAYAPCIGAACTIIIFLIGCSEMIVVRLTHLKELLEAAVHAENPTQCRRLINNCVKYHIHIISLAKQFNYCYNWYYFIYFLENNLLISMNGFNFIMSPKVSTFINFTGWFVALWLTCIAGQRLIDESTSVGNAIYATNWYEIDTTMQKTLKLMILRSQRQLYIDAWMSGTSSLLTLTAILKTSYSIIALLNTIYE